MRIVCTTPDLVQYVPNVDGKSGPVLPLFAIESQWSLSREKDTPSLCCRCRTKCDDILSPPSPFSKLAMKASTESEVNDTSSTSIAEASSSLSIKYVAVTIIGNGCTGPWSHNGTLCWAIRSNTFFQSNALTLFDQPTLWVPIWRSEQRSKKGDLTTDVPPWCVFLWSLTGNFWSSCSLPPWTERRRAVTWLRPTVSMAHQDRTTSGEIYPMFAARHPSALGSLMHTCPCPRSASAWRFKDGTMATSATVEALALETFLTTGMSFLLYLARATPSEQTWLESSSALGGVQEVSRVATTRLMCPWVPEHSLLWGCQVGWTHGSLSHFDCYPRCPRGSTGRKPKDCIYVSWT